VLTMSPHYWPADLSSSLKSRRFHGRPGDLFPACVLFLEISTNLSATILITCSSHSLLIFSTHSLIGWIPTPSKIEFATVTRILKSLNNGDDDDYDYDEDDDDDDMSQSVIKFQ
jgi:hypothetical protein